MLGPKHPPWLFPPPSEKLSICSQRSFIQHGARAGQELMGFSGCPFHLSAPLIHKMSVLVGSEQTPSAPREARPLQQALRIWVKLAFQPALSSFFLHCLPDILVAFRRKCQSNDSDPHCSLPSLQSFAQCYSSLLSLVFVLSIQLDLQPRG